MKKAAHAHDDHTAMPLAASTCVVDNRHQVSRFDLANRRLLRQADDPGDSCGCGKGVALTAVKNAARREQAGGYRRGRERCEQHHRAGHCWDGTKTQHRPSARDAPILGSLGCQ
jgi:hypothetical protein